MRYLSRFFKDTVKYYEYVKVATKANLKTEVAGSYLSWLWWILDPMLFMLIYTFVCVIVFDRPQEYLAAFIFIGLSSWDFFNHVIQISVNLVQKNSGVISKVYVPKFVLIYIEMGIWGFKMLISFSLVAITMFLYRIHITHRILYVIPAFVVLLMFTFGCATLLLHFGVYIQDLTNVIRAVLRLVFYMSGVFYSIDKTPEPFRTILMNFNPLALVMDSLRRCMLYAEKPRLFLLGVWFAIGLLLAIIG
ncbi:MAG: ABC transporter permease, partial [Lachnospiraceae bacterium]|nr:ABC transporter permease [Lachnospiraceae bacterium]